MKRILTGLLAIGMAAATWAVNDDIPIWAIVPSSLKIL